MNRRDFIKVGGLGFGLSALPLSELEAQQLSSGDKAVVLVWLSGGPTHVETFDPKMTAPSEYRSINGDVSGKLMNMGGLWNELIKQEQHINLVRSFSHTNNSHAQATHYVMTGTNTNDGQKQSVPSPGSVVARYYGSNHHNGQPNYVRQQRVYGDGGVYLGASTEPFTASSDAVKNLGLNIDPSRFESRKALLASLDSMKANLGGVDDYREQAEAILRGKVRDSFDLNRETPEVRERYGRGIGDNLLLARRLIEAGTKFVTINYGGWDMHNGIEKSLNSRIPPLDKSLASFTIDLKERGLLENVLVVITGEFGRTPKINNNAGRDHWGKLSTLAFIGGGYESGRIIGESDSKVSEPISNPVGPMDLRATIFDHMGLPSDLQYFDHAGRPQYMLPEGKVIL